MDEPMDRSGEQNGTIEKKELVDALKGMFPVEPGALEEVIEMNWRSWDADNNGTLGTGWPFA